MNPAPEGFRVLSSYSNIPSLCLPTATEVTYGSVLIFGRCNTELSCAAESPTEGTPAIGLPANQRRTLGVSFSDLLGKAISRDAMPRSPTAQRDASSLRVCFGHRRSPPVTVGVALFFSRVWSRSFFVVTFVLRTHGRCHSLGSFLFTEEVRVARPGRSLVFVRRRIK